MLNAALLAWLVTVLRPGRWRLGGGIAAVALATWLTSIVIENRNWHEAARRAERMVVTFPVRELEAPPSRVVVTGVPAHHHGAWLFVGGFRLAVALYADPPGRVQEVRPEEWRSE